MITAYVGLPGSGKSYGVCEQVILPALAKGRPVFTNIPFDTNLCLEKYECAPIYFDTDDIKEDANWWNDVFQAGALLVIDEVWTLWAAGLKANNAREEDKVFLNKHRHMTGGGFATEIVLVTQDLAQISSFVRLLVETTYQSKKLTEVGADGAFKIRVYSGAVTGQKPPETSLLQTLGPFKYKPDVYLFYQSQTMGNGSQSSEKRIDSRVNLLKSGNLKWYGIGFVFTLFFISFALGEVADGFSPQDEEPVVDSAVVGVGYVPLRSVLVPDYVEEFENLVITNNNSILGYRFTLDESYRADFSIKQLRSLGVTVAILSDCLAKLTYETEFVALVGCESQKSSISLSSSLSDAI